MNVVALVGNLATDPELRTTSSERKVCTFRLAVSRPNNTDEADFFSVVTWGRQAEVCAEYLSIGRRVAVDGRLHHSTWQVEEGDGNQPSRRSRVEVVAHRVEMIGGPRREHGTANAEGDQAGTAAPDLGSSAGGEDIESGAPTPEFAVH